MNEPSDMLTVLRTSAHDLHAIPDATVHAIICSPPYFGLRQYQGDQDVEWPTVEYRLNEWTEPIMVQGCDPDCTHEWVLLPPRPGGAGNSPDKPSGFQQKSKAGQTGALSQMKSANEHGGRYCTHCGGWRGPLGLEPSPVAFVGHLILCLREWGRVLRGDGACWVNLGSSYASGGKIANPSGLVRRERSYDNDGKGRPSSQVSDPSYRRSDDERQADLQSRHLRKSHSDQPHSANDEHPCTTDHDNEHQGYEQAPPDASVLSSQVSILDASSRASRQNASSQHRETDTPSYVHSSPDAAQGYAHKTAFPSELQTYDGELQDRRYGSENSAAIDGASTHEGACIMGDTENDLDRIAKSIDDALAMLTGNSHEPHPSFGDSLTITKDGWIAGVIRLQRLRDYVEGLSRTHKDTIR